MQHDIMIFTVFVVFTGAAILGSIALYARQSLLVAYILLGGLLGPWGFRLVSDPSIANEIGHVGIIFLLFLLGLDLQPQNLLRMIREATFVTLLSSALFLLIGMMVGWWLNYTLLECVLIGAMMTFSSTIIGLKLLPTTELHHRRMGEVIISILLLQDIIAILVLLLLQGSGAELLPWKEITLLALALPALLILAFTIERYVLRNLIARFDTIREYIFLVTIGWCLGIAHLATGLGLSYEMGAFIAGVAMATSPIAQFITESLKPLRDFFLIMFFFSLGASFKLPELPNIVIPSMVLATCILIVKPLVFQRLLTKAGESPKLSKEIGVRLGQVSEFSLLIAVVAVNVSAIREQVSYLIQATTLLTFIGSSYWVMLKYPTPIAVHEHLRRD